MKISIGADHAGFALKEELKKHLADLGHVVVDHGTTGTESTDYPDYALAVGDDVSQGRVDRGMLVCSTGVGMSIAANKVPGVRAALGWNPEEARLIREHNDANVLTLGAKYTDKAHAEELTDIFLNTEFLGGRHARRTAKIAAAEYPGGA
ncbi:MAG TPA: ribose 5-phosphate isomerase B [Bryobacteraceae bacterium]|nr:ribose 5-phosphate isomerase B [Bryobacteraceae bacterium]